MTTAVICSLVITKFSIKLAAMSVEGSKGFTFLFVVSLLIVIIINSLIYLYQGEYIKVGIIIVFTFVPQYHNIKIINFILSFIQIYLCGWSGFAVIVFFIVTECMFGYTEEVQPYGKSSSVTLYKLGHYVYFSMNYIKCDEDRDVYGIEHSNSGYFKCVWFPEPVEKIDGEADVKTD